MKFPTLTPEERLARLAPPTGAIRVVIDSDTYNEVDDQFAIAYAMMSQEKMTVEAVYAAPFSAGFFLKLLDSAEKALPMTSNIAEGMEQSYQEILRLHKLLGVSPEGRVFRGSTQYMRAAGEPVESEAARDLVRRANESEGPLYVLAIGEITNVASAILMDPGIIRKIVIVWLAGQPLYWPHAVEFNLGQDVFASQTILDSGVPLVLVPCMTVASNLTVTAPELETRLKGKSRVGTYLSDTVTCQLTQEMGNRWLNLINKTYNYGLDDYGAENTPCTDVALSPSRIIWDISTVAYAVNPNWVPSTLEPTPWLTDDLHWRQDPARPLMRLCRFAYRDAVFGDMFAKLQKAPQ
ncbi:MAG: nucleoside hydrolase [Eubacteriales bacterium]|nr:nucleoside hydrolase [Eubacteriales bacterium]